MVRMIGSHSWLARHRTVPTGIALALAASLSLAGCGNASSSASSSADTSDDGKEMTVDVFDSLANVAGAQKGWFAKIVKDKFNIKLNYSPRPSRAAGASSSTPVPPPATSVTSSSRAPATAASPSSSSLASSST